MNKLIALVGPNSGTTTKPGEQSFAESLRSSQRLSVEGSSPDGLVFVDFDTDPTETKLRYQSGIPSALIRQEPRIVRPQNYRKDFLDSMKLIIDVGRPPGTSNPRVNWPQDWKLHKLEESVSNKSKRSDRFAMINRNLMSFVSGEMYSLRRILAQKSREIDVWGMGWDMPLVPRAVRVLEEILIPLRHGFGVDPTALKGWFKRPLSLLGPTKDKLSTLSSYNYSLVIENSTDYMSEKLFDCLFTGTLPVYVGPEPRLYGIPDFVAIHAEPNVESVTKSMDIAKAINLEKWRRSVLDWLKSDGVEKMWSGPFVLSQILEIIDMELFEKEKN